MPKRAAGSETNATPEEEALYTSLVKASYGRRASKAAEVDWVMEHIDVPIKNIDAKRIPGPGAITLLKWARASTANRAEFIVKIWAKRVPTKAAEEKDSELRDDGRDVESIITDFVRQRALSRSAVLSSDPERPE